MWKRISQFMGILVEETVARVLGSDCTCSTAKSEAEITRTEPSQQLRFAFFFKSKSCFFSSVLSVLSAAGWPYRVCYLATSTAGEGKFVTYERELKVSLGTWYSSELPMSSAATS